MAFVNEKNVLLHQNAANKDEALRTIADYAATLGLTDDADAVYEAFLAREDMGETGMTDGFAVPHAKTDAIKRAAVIVVKNNRALEWPSFDDKPVDVAISLLVPDGEAVVGGKDAVDGNLVVRLRDAPLAVGGEVDLGAVRVGAQRATRAVVALRLAEARVNGEVLVDVDAADAVRGVACGVELGLGGLEARGEAAVLYGVLVAHAVDDDADGVRGEKKARGQGDGGAHEEEDADVLAQVVAQLPGEAPC